MAESNKLTVEIVSPERELWAGEGDMIIAQTLEGEIGVQPGHVPVLSLLTSGGVVRVLGGRESGEVRAAVHGGYMSVEGNRVSVLAEVAELSEEIDVGRAKSAVERSPGDTTDEEAQHRAARAQSRLRAAGQAS